VPRAATSLFSPTFFLCALLLRLCKMRSTASRPDRSLLWRSGICYGRRARKAEAKVAMSRGACNRARRRISGLLSDGLLSAKNDGGERVIEEKSLCTIRRSGNGRKGPGVACVRKDWK
jgi:hypothetical protein